MKGVVDDSPREISRSLVAAAVLAVVASCCCSSLVAATTAGKLVFRFTTFSCGTSFTLIFPGSIAIGVFVCLSVCHSYIRKKTMSDHFAKLFDVHVTTGRGSDLL